MGRTRARPLVLLVDDEPRVLSALRRSLRRADLDIETAADAARAIERLEAGPPVDLVISDHKMPGMTGLELLGEVARRWPDTERILLSGWTAELDARAIARAGIAATLAKPWEAGELDAALGKALGR